MSVRRKKQQLFQWNEEKKRVVVECLARARIAGGTIAVISEVVLRDFAKVFTDCKLAAKTLYMLALDAESGKQLPGETKTRVHHWTTEKDTFLIECDARAREEDLRCLQLGLYESKRGVKGNYKNLIVQYFTEKYKDEHSATAIYKRIRHLYNDGRIVRNDNSETSSLCNPSTISLALSELGNPTGVNYPVDGTDGRNNHDSRLLLRKADIESSTGVNYPVNGTVENGNDSKLLFRKVDIESLTGVNYSVDGTVENSKDSKLLLQKADIESSAKINHSVDKTADSNVQINLNHQKKFGCVNDALNKLEITEKQVKPASDPDMILFFKRTMRCWEDGFKFSTKPLFIGACANCSAIIPNDTGFKTENALQHKVFNHYEEKDIALKVVHPTTKKSLLCTLCSKKDLLVRYRLAPDQVKSLSLPKVIEDVSENDKRHISLVALKSNTAKASNDALRIFHHLKGDYIAERKGDAYYMDMYAMIVNQGSVSATNGDIKVISAALRWLRKNNHLFRTFAANYETLLRYAKRQTGQPVTVPVVDDLDFDPVSDKQTKTSVLDAEQAALMVPAYNVSARGVNVGNTITAIQHVRPQSAHEKLVNVYLRDPYLEAKVFPWLFPYGIGGWPSGEGYCLTRGKYLQWRLRMYDCRFRDETDYIFYMLDLLIKERLQYYSGVKVNVARLQEPLTAHKIQTAEPYKQYGTDVPSTIPNSRNYWASKTLDLIAMSEYMGRVPDFFVTLTENDSWPELQAVIKNGIAGVHQAADSKEHETVHKCGAPAMKYAVHTVIAFYRRLQLFRKKFLQDPAGPFGKILDYWIRIEYQKRGSLHAHLVVWCDQTTIPNGVVSAEMPRFNHPMNDRWRDIVGSYQKHTCYQQRCFTGKRGAVLVRCKYGYPYKVNDTVSLQTGSIRYNYIRHKREDSMIVTYNLPLLLLWDGHVNVQHVTNGGWELYLAKYVAKSEYPIRMRLSRKKQQSDCEMYLRTRVVSLLEAATLLLQHPHVFSSREVIYLPIDINPAYRFLKRQSDMRRNTSASNDELYYDTKLDKYLDRPKALNHLTYSQFYAKYRYVGQVAMDNEVIDDEFDCENASKSATKADGKTLCDRKGRQIRERLRHEAIVRFKEYSPYGDDLEKYCLTKLLQNVPVDRTSITTLKDTTGSYLDECLRRNLIREEDEAMQFLEGAAKRGNTLQRLREIASRLIDGNWLQNQDINQLLETVAPYQMEAERLKGLTIDDDDDDKVIIGDRDGLDLKVQAYLPVNEYIAGFTASQRAAFDYVTGKWLKGEQCLVFITGGGGVGKSFLLDSLVAFCREHQKTVQKLATTGCAAHLIGGLTIHTFLRMGADLVSCIERGSTDAFFIQHLQVLLIDEVSMLDERVMQKLEESMILHGTSDNYCAQRFAGKSVIMFGDPAQLPPVGNHIWQPKLLKGFQYVVLKEIVRQKNDFQFVDLLKRVRLGEPTQADIDLLKTREISQADLQQVDMGEHGLMLFPTRRQKDAINELKLAKLQGNERVYHAQDVDGNNMPLPKSAREYVAEIEHYMQLFPSVLKLKIGARVMLIRNRDIEHGWVNGKLARIVNMSDDYIVLVALDNPNRKLITFRTRQEIRCKSGEKQLFRKQFPLDLAYGVTVHKSQGQTLDVIVVSARGFSFSGQFYTAISRVRELTGLYLIDFDPESIYLAPNLRRFIDWIDEVDIIRQHASGWIRPSMPIVAQIKSVNRSVNKTQVVNSPNRKRPVINTVPHNTVCDGNGQQTVPKRPRCQPSQQFNVEYMLRRIHRIDPNVPLMEYWRTFDIIINDNEMFQFSLQWDLRVTQANRCVFDDKSPYYSIDEGRSQETYSAISKQCSRVIKTSADGSCMFHALSLCLFGQECYSSELRLLSILGFRKFSEVFDTVHAQNHLDYTSVQQLIHQTSNMQGGIESWGNAAHLKSLACTACREIYVYTCFARDDNGRVHRFCWDNRNLSIEQLQRKNNEGSLYGAYFTRYEPYENSIGKPLSVLLSGAGASAHYSAVLPISEDAPMVRPHVVIPPPPANNETVPMDYIDISDTE